MDFSYNYKKIRLFPISKSGGSNVKCIKINTEEKGRIIINAALLQFSIAKSLLSTLLNKNNFILR
jgi:hypothetical protein